MSEQALHDTPGTEPPPVRQVAPGRVIDWLLAGWRDFRAAGWPSFMHGVIVSVASLVIIDIALIFWPLLPGAVSGFLVVGPILATGLYALSRRIEAGKTPRFVDARCAWRNATKCLLRFSLLLVAGASTWVLASMLLFHFFVNANIEHPLDFVRYVLVQNDVYFMLWTVLAGLVAALAFGLTVVSMPLLVDRDVTTPLALATSLRAVGENPVTMTWWAVIILVATGICFATFMVGFLVLYPVLGHASWHVYRDLVDADDLPVREIVGNSDA